jgi:hypothetical protein
VKRFLANNFGTIAMSFVLALLLWIYLYNESTDTVEFTNVTLAPAVQEHDLASFEFLDDKGQPFAPNGTIDIKITGPKGELRALSRKVLRCEPIFSKDAFADPVKGDIARTLTAEDLNVPENFRVDYRPSAKIRLRYVKYRTKTVKLEYSDREYEGNPSPGFEVRGISVDPEKIDVKIPADRDLEKVRIKKIPIDNRSESFVKESWMIDPSDVSYSVVQLGQFRASVRIEVRTKSKDFTVPLYMAGPVAIVRHLELQTASIKVQVSGSESVVDKVTPDMLYAFVVVDLTELPAVGERRVLDKIHCIVRNETLAPDLKVVIMPDVKPENRQVDVKAVSK